MVLELLAAVCLVRGGHEIILAAFDNFKEVSVLFACVWVWAGEKVGNLVLKHHFLGFLVILILEYLAKQQAHQMRIRTKAKPELQSH